MLCPKCGGTLALVHPSSEGVWGRTPAEYICDDCGYWCED